MPQDVVDHPKFQLPQNAALCLYFAAPETGLRLDIAAGICHGIESLGSSAVAVGCCRWAECLENRQGDGGLQQCRLPIYVSRLSRTYSERSTGKVWLCIARGLKLPGHGLPRRCRRPSPCVRCKPRRSH
jgi:hypothetical protein